MQIKILGGHAKPMLESRGNVSSIAQSEDFGLLCFSRLHVKIDRNQLVQFLMSLTHPLNLCIPLL